MLIREDTGYDRVEVHDVISAAFGRLGEATLVDHLKADGDSVISLVAVDDARIIGHIMLSKLNAPFKALGLAPLSVRPERQRSGVGSLLVREGLSRARQEDWDAVFVLGDPVFYRRFGFDQERASGFSCRYAGMHFMVHPIRNSLPALTGKIDYPPAFAALE